MDELKTFLSEQYALPEVEVKPLSAGGFINTSYEVTTPTQKYILIQSKNLLRKAAQEGSVLQYLEEKKIPAISYVKNCQGEFCCKKEDSLLLLSQYIEGTSPHRFNDLTEKQIVSAAKTLAKLHLQLKQYPQSPFQNNPNTATKAKALEICLKIQETLKQRKETHELNLFDQHVFHILDKKIAALKSFNDLSLMKKLNACPQQFCHGDYHGANLIFNDNDEVKAICDWEFFGYDYRIWEVVRAMCFICDLEYTGSLLGPIDFTKANIFLKVYHHLFPLTPAEWEVIIPLLQFKSLCSCFVLEKHYLEGQVSSDIFLPKKEENWFWWQNNSTVFEQQILLPLQK